MAEYQYNTTNQGTAPKSVGEYWQKVNELGGTANYMKNYPQVYDPTYRWWQDKTYGMPNEMQSVMLKGFVQFVL